MNGQPTHHLTWVFGVVVRRLVSCLVEEYRRILMYLLVSHEIAAVSREGRILSMVGPTQAAGGARHMGKAASQKPTRRQVFSRPSPRQRVAASNYLSTPRRMFHDEIARAQKSSVVQCFRLP